jgi:small-conductance mechanosensitive channel
MSAVSRRPQPAVLALALAALLCAPATRTMAQDPTPLPMTDKMPVVLDGRVLFEVGESGTWSPEQRAREINRILRAAAADPEPVNLTLAEHDGFPTIRMGDWHLLTVTDSDVVTGMDPGEQAQRWLQTVEAALLQARLERSTPYLSAAWLRVVAAFVLAALLHWLLGRISRRLPVRLTRRRGLPAPSALGGRAAWQVALQLVCAGLQAVTWIAALRYTTDAFPASRQLWYEVGVLVGGSLRAPLFNMNERSYSALDLLWLAGAVAALWVSVSVFTRVLSSRLQRATGATRGALQPTATLVRYGLIFVGLIVILQVAGLNLSSLAIFASVLGVGIGFGLQSIANNFVSGIIISFERAIKPGDFVSLGDLQGTVQSVGARSTIVRTLDRVSIIVPNARLLENEVVNWSHGDDLVRLHLPIGVAYGSAIESLRGVLLDTAKSHPGVLADPRPDVRFLGFGDSALNLELLVWSNDPPGQALLKSDLFYQVEANLRRAGIEIPFPQRTLHVSADEIGAVVDRIRDARAPEQVALYDPSGAPTVVRHPDAPAHHAPLVAHVPTSPPPARTVDIDALIAHMRGPDGLAIEDRRHLLAVYPKCFVGSDAVEWLMRTREVTRDAAIRLGQSLVEHGIIHHVLDEHPFRDGNFYYRFYADEARAEGKSM